MTLSDIAAGIEVVERQRDRGVAAVDDTGESLVDRLAPCAEDLPCAVDAAVTVVETYADGAAVGAAGHEAGVAPITAGKVLHLVGVDGVSPVGPEARRVIRDWLDGRLGRCEARTLAGAGEAEFLLAAYVERTAPIPAAVEAVEPLFSTRRDAAVSKRDHLAATMSGVGDLR